MEQEQKRRGRPPTGRGRKPRIDITVSQEVSDFLRWYGLSHNISGFIEDLIKASPDYQYARAAQQ